MLELELSIPKEQIVTIIQTNIREAYVNYYLLGAFVEQTPSLFCWQFDHSWLNPFDNCVHVASLDAVQL
jgi:hypothetical protein